MFDKIFGTRPPANDEPGLQRSQDRNVDAAIERCVKPEGQDFIRAIFLTGEGGDRLDAGDYDGAVQRFDAALEVSPGGWQAGNTHVMLGITHHKCGRYEAARNAFTCGIECNCSSPHEAYRRRSFVQAALGDFNAALADMRRSAAEGEDPAFIAAKLCAIFLVMGDAQAASAAVAETQETQASEAQFRLEQMQSRVEVRLLLGDRLGAQADLDMEPELAEGDGADIALWRYILRRRAGLTGLTPTIAAQIAASDNPSTEGFLKWFETGDVEARDQSLAGIESLPATDDRITAFCESHYRLGAMAECVGDRESAIHHYTFASAHPEAAWCIEYALAQYGLRRVEGAAAG